MANYPRPGGSGKPSHQSKTRSRPAGVTKKHGGPAGSKGGNTGGAEQEEVVFDFAEREKFLTGFHKRKMDRQRAAREKAEARDREERIRQRAEVSLALLFSFFLFPFLSF